MSAYFDWAATALPDRAICTEALEASLALYGNPSSVHAPGKAARAAIEVARDRAARALCVKTESVFFTSGGTESNHLPMLSLLQRPVRGSIAISAIEHPSIVEQARMLELSGWKTLVIPVTKEGFISIDAVMNTIRDDTAYVSCMAVNNETGAIQNIREIAESLLHLPAGRKKPHFHVDAVQAAGKIPLELSQPGIDSASISAHKIGGPRGIGCLYLPRKFEAFIRGGGQESGIRPGTENLAGIIALSRALELHCVSDGTVSRPKDEDRAKKSMARIIEEIRATGKITVIPQSRTPDDSRFSPFVLQCTNARIPGEVLVRALSEREVYISTGSACSSKKKGRPVLQAMNLSPDAQQNAFRISIGCETTMEDIDELTGALSAVFSQM